MTNKTPEIPPETTSTEDSSGRTASSTAAEGSQRLAAWNAGLVWDRMRHALAVAFITGRRTYGNTARNLARQLSLAVRPLVESIEEKDEVTGLIDTAMEDVFAHLESEHFAEERADRERQLDPDRYINSFDGRPELLHELAADPESKMEQIRQELKRRMDEEDLRIFLLGIEVNRGVYSKDVLDDLAPAECEVPDVVDYNELSMAGTGDPLVQSQPRSRRRNIPTDLRDDWRERPVTDQWKPLVETRWGEAGLPLDRLPWRLPGGQSIELGAASTVDAVVEVAEELLVPKPDPDNSKETGANSQPESGQVAEEPDHEKPPTDEESGEGDGDQRDPKENEEPDPWSAEMEFGLSFKERTTEDHRFLVRRNGFSAEDRVTSRFDFKLLRHFAERGAHEVSFDDLKESWRAFGGRGEPTDRTIYNRICGLNNWLPGSLGLTIKNSGSRAYYLAAHEPKLEIRKSTRKSG